MPASYELQRIQEKHHEILRLATMGLSAVEIGKSLNITTVSVANALNSQASQMRLAFLRRLRDAKMGAVAERLQEGASKALSVLENAIEGDLDGLDAKGRLGAAFGWLDRAGFGPTRNINAKHLIGVVTPEMLDSINKVVEDANCSEE